MQPLKHSRYSQVGTAAGRRRQTTQILYSPWILENRVLPEGRVGQEVPAEKSSESDNDCKKNRNEATGEQTNVYTQRLYIITCVSDVTDK